MLVANATGCSSIYGGNLPTTPWAKDAQGHGPAWCNSLFEDNAEFGVGFRMSVDYKAKEALRLLKALQDTVGVELAQQILGADQSNEAGLAEQRKRVEALKAKLKGSNAPEAIQLMQMADYLVKKSVWIMGGDGWAYDIGYGGLDHVLGSGMNVNVLVLDTEVYSNTGGQMSKSTPKSAVAKFAAIGKQNVKKDLGLMAMTYRNVYVARVAMGYSDAQTLRAMVESRGVQRPVVDHRLQPLHQPRHRHDQRTQAAEGRSGFRAMAAVPLQPPASGEGRESSEARLGRSEDPSQGLLDERKSLPDVGDVQAGRGREAP